MNLHNPGSGHLGTFSLLVPKMAEKEVTILDKDRLDAEKDQNVRRAQNQSPKKRRAQGFNADHEERRILSDLRDQGYKPVKGKDIQPIARVLFPSRIRSSPRPLRGLIHSKEEALASVDVLLPPKFFKLRADALNDSRERLIAAGHRNHHSSNVSIAEVEEAIYLQQYLPFLGNGTQKINFDEAKAQGLTSLSYNKFEYIISEDSLDIGKLLDCAR